MFDYLQQFKSLPKELREKVSSDSAMAILAELEKKYNVSLAPVIMKVMVKSISLHNLPAHLSTEFSLRQETANNLSNELKEKLFFSVAGYLGLNLNKDKEVKQAVDIIKEANLVFPSSDLENRCRHIITTYIRGVRSRLDTRLSLEKPVNVGGLNLDKETVDNIMKICSSAMFDKGSKPSPPKVSPEALNKIIEKEEVFKEKSFDLKKEIELGHTPSLAKNKEPKKIEAAKDFKFLDAPKLVNLPSPPKNISKPVEVKKEDKKIKDKKVNLPPPPPPAKKESEENKQVDDKLKFAPPTKPRLLNFSKKRSDISPDLKESLEKEEEKEKIVKKPVNIQSRSGNDSGSRVKMEDIKVVPKVMGPIDELRYLSIANFRRLGENPSEIIAKVKAKIDMLEKDGYDKKVEGINAWKKSPVSRSYLSIGQEAIKRGVSIQEVVKNRQEKDKDSLSLEEIKAIIAFNSNLSF